MTRAREETAARGTREGILAALVNTGGVVTGAGLILAGTFATLTLLPLEELVQIGATVAIGVLLDTFVVRALLIPAITYRLGERAWWPQYPVPVLTCLRSEGWAPPFSSSVAQAWSMSSASRSTCSRLSVSLTSARSTFTPVGVGRQRVGGQHPAALGRELPGEVELVVVLARRRA